MMKPIELPLGDTLDVNEVKLIVIALLKAARDHQHADFQVKMRDVAYKLMRQVPPPLDADEIEP